MNKLGFGFLRLPFNGDMVDDLLLNRMVDAYMAAGGKYFDTAYTYLNGKSEAAIRRCVVERKKRDSFLLCDKLPGYMVKSHDDCQRFFSEQQRRCGVDYFDVYMLHWLNATNYAIAEKYDEFGFLMNLKEQGRARRIGFSFHDSPELLDEILTRHPEVDCVLLQINYMDWESPSIQSRRCYETAVAHGVSVMVMEPVKGGTLANVPADVRAALQSVDSDASPASQAIRFVQSLEHVEYVLSGMNSMEQVMENLEIPVAIDEAGKAAMLKAAEVLRSSIAVACTGCGYCLSHCPKSIPIPKVFTLYNDIVRTPADDWKIQPVYARLTQNGAKASACIACGACARACPQKLPVPDVLKQAAALLE